MGHLPALLYSHVQQPSLLLNISSYSALALTGNCDLLCSLLNEVVSYIRGMPTRVEQKWPGFPGQICVNSSSDQPFRQSWRNFLRSSPCSFLASAWLEHSTDLALRSFFGAAAVGVAGTAGAVAAGALGATGAVVCAKAGAAPSEAARHKSPRYLPNVVMMISILEGCTESANPNRIIRLCGRIMRVGS